MRQKDDESQTARRSADTAFGTVISPGVTIRGELASEEAVDVAGTFEGDSLVAAHYRVRAGGCVKGTIEARTLAVEGIVQSSKVVADKLEIGASGRIEGRVQARVVTIEAGARFDGELEMPGADAGAGPTSLAEQRRRE
jgi:cytoskeletal protein CcmA (bactofilin family)